MPNLTTLILSVTTEIARIAAFVRGYGDGLAGRRDTETGDIIAGHREAVGFVRTKADVLTPPDANMKLDKGVTPSYGLTLAHALLSRWNACPWAGDCTKVCVLNNGNGRYSTTQMAWLWRTNFLADNPLEALYRIGWELGRAVRKNGDILFRPNVNSDLRWDLILPNLGNVDGIRTYGYSKNPGVLMGNGRPTGIYTAYSWNENSNAERVRSYLNAGGAVAVVTNRKPKSAIDKDAVRLAMGVGPEIDVVDADLTDEWMFQSGVIGDLSAKGKARDLIGVSGFVVCAY
jgi:hypothetical protein